ncbi:MAG: cation transporter, partial [Clostridia bacterium]|nr:cation transporter [Clostridia bacterium]
MISILKHFFIQSNMTAAEERTAYGTMCGFLGILLNVLLFAGKYFAGLLSGSIGIMADAFNNLSDAGSSVLTLIGFKFSSRKADKEHPFGHGRYEYITGLAISVIIILVGYELGRSSIDKILHPAPVEGGLLPICILLASIGVKFYMFFYNKHIGSKIGSPAMGATAADCLNDCIATAVVLGSMLANMFFYVNIDGWCGIFVACFILWAGISSARETLSPLLGRAPDPEVIEEVTRIALSYPEILAVHDLVVHDYGPGRLMISLHAEVSGDGNIYVLHDVMEQAEAAIDKAVGCESVIHMDPIETNNEEVGRMRTLVTEAALSIDDRVTVHDFRMIKCVDYSNLIFDAVLPLDSRLSNKEFEEKLHEEIE